ncbi:MAG: hypothetical protein B7Y93_05955 [Micrococcales bacterium 32-70-13]|nr:MAG: hypothetical protein B7Y93_05955 [Micrococcales bacterium 32-70-13]
MISHRLRAVVAGIPIAVLSTVIIASPGFAAESLRIATPLAGATVSGQLIIEGSIAGDAADLDLGLAPQSLGDCGSPLVETSIALAGEQFTTSIPTAALPDGTYCLIAVADAGRLSTVVADITVDNSATAPLEGLQLPTESLDGEETATQVPVVDSILGDLAVLGPLALGATAVLAVIVLGLGLWARRRTAA